MPFSLNIQNNIWSFSIANIWTFKAYLNGGSVQKKEVIFCSLFVSQCNNAHSGIYVIFMSIIKL